jgi:hypothetical protein
MTGRAQMAAEQLRDGHVCLLSGVAGSLRNNDNATQPKLWEALNEPAKNLSYGIPGASSESV